MISLLPHYWLLERWDGETIKVKPENAPQVQSLITKGEGFIRTKTRTINVKDIKSFDESDIPYSDQKLLEDASRAFNSVLISKIDNEELIQAKWVKKTIPNKRWEAYYVRQPSYKFLYENESGVTMAFVIPTHAINPNRVTEMTTQELLQFKL